MKNLFRILSIVCLEFIASSTSQEALTVSPEDDIEAQSAGGGIWSVKSGTSIQWKALGTSDSMVMQFTLQGPSVGYIAMAISEDTSMGNDDVYLCSQSSGEVTITSAHLTGFSAPTIDEQITEAQGNSGSVEEGTITCTFNRPFSVTKTVSGTPVTWNIGNTPFNLLYAEGELLSGNAFAYHTFRVSTTSRFSLASNAGYRQAEAAGRGTVDTSVAVNSNDDIVALPGDVGGSWLVPTTRSECPMGSCRTIQWRPVVGPGGERMIQFTILGNPTGWVGIAISRDRNMGDDDAYYCSRSSPQSSDVTVTSAVLTGRSRPSVVGPVQNERIFIAAVEDERLVCNFLRPLSVTKSVGEQSMTWDLSQKNFNLLFAEGSVGSDGSLSYHTFRASTNSPFHFLSTAGYKSLSSLPINPSGVLEEPNFLPEVDTTGSANGGLTWTFPYGCGQDSNPCRHVSFQPILVNGTEMIATTILGTGPNDYIGFLITESVQSGSGDCYYCFREIEMEDTVQQARIVSAVCINNGLPVPEETIPPERVLSIVSTEDILSCTFLRPVSVTKTINGEPTSFDISANNYSLIYGEGPLDEGGKISTPSYVAFTPFSLQLIDLALFRGEEGEPGIEPEGPVDEEANVTAAPEGELPEVENPETQTSASSVEPQGQRSSTSQETTSTTHGPDETLSTLTPDERESSEQESNEEELSEQEASENEASEQEGNEEESSEQEDNDGEVSEQEGHERATQPGLVEMTTDSEGHVTPSNFAVLILAAALISSLQSLLVK